MLHVNPSHLSAQTQPQPLLGVFQKSPNTEKAIQTEQNILKLSGLKPNSDIHSFDVPIEMHRGKLEQIHTVRCGDHNTKVMVLVHGYGGTNLTWYKMMKELSQTQRVQAIDLIGMGLSSRPILGQNDPATWLDYFVETLEEWRKYLNIERMVLVGHSFGGHISGHYALKQKQQIERLCLVSPAGVTKYTQEEENSNYMKSTQKKVGFFEKLGLKAFDQALGQKMTPTKMYQLKQIGKLFYKNQLLKHLKCGDVEIELWMEYMKQCFKLRESTEEAIQILFKFPRLSPIFPLEDLFNEDMGFRVDLTYGMDDWMDTKGAINMKARLGEKVTIRFIHNAGHLIPVENPARLASLILNSEQTNKKTQES